MSTPDLSAYRAVHGALRSTTHRLADAVAGLDTADRNRVAALARYWEGFAGEVHTHHTLEDDSFFPALVEKVPVVAEHLARIDGEHERLDELMTASAQAIAGLADLPTPSVAARPLAQLAEHMDRHLDFEDADILPLFERHFSAEEYDALNQAAHKSLGIGRQAAFTVPWLAASVSDDEREHLLGDAPRGFRLLYRLTRGRFARLETAALGGTSVRQGVAS